MAKAPIFVNILLSAKRNNIVKFKNNHFSSCRDHFVDLIILEWPPVAPIPYHDSRRRRNVYVVNLNVTDDRILNLPQSLDGQTESVELIVPQSSSKFPGDKNVGILNRL